MKFTAKNAPLFVVLDKFANEVIRRWCKQASNDHINKVWSAIAFVFMALIC